MIIIADPILIAKAAAAVLSNGKLRKGVGWIIVAILSPIIVTIALILEILSGTASHNSTALELSFNGGAISEKASVEFRMHIEDMRYSFSLLDYDIKSINSKTEDNESLDSVRVKAVFYALYFGDERPSLINTLQFADCFVVYERRTRTVLLGFIIFLILVVSDYLNHTLLSR
ncbi:hypothetical protein [Sinanaerobacter sp. ZZT-01]|uniref:hypothetical protein n=1 Tax=Sinanaerobacter sp. ZZT-01 TaxID=3111540 RepID=UPI002D787A72|nr:hypothetical protein [Sinanaerobacter sp. ZZT-01]WRR93817.1 hypothetical protein U5921_01445 [Sinanaerobacter sp. ZZT-01]